MCAGGRDGGVNAPRPPDFPVGRFGAPRPAGRAPDLESARESDRDPDFAPGRESLAEFLESGRLVRSVRFSGRRPLDIFKLFH